MKVILLSSKHKAITSSLLIREGEREREREREREIGAPDLLMSQLLVFRAVLIIQ
jgi:hypothetical protein